MLNEKTLEQTAQTVTEAVEIGEFVGKTGHQHRDQYAHYSHELPDDTADAASRALARTVPIAYGVLLGLTTGEFWVWLTAGLVLGLGLDLGNRQRSIARRAYTRLYEFACPRLARSAGRVTQRLSKRGVRVPGRSHQGHCRMSR